MSEGSRVSLDKDFSVGSDGKEIIVDLGGSEYSYSLFESRTSGDFSSV